MRAWIPIAAVLALHLAAGPTRATSARNSPPDPDAVAALEAQAIQAQPREQCFLDAQLVHSLADLSIRQYAAGDVNEAADLFKKVQNATRKFHISLTGKGKRLKDAQILLSHTAFRLNELLHVSSFEDRPLVEETLAGVTQAEDAAMMQVFQK